jgi:glycosyltransferase involved in cell wall biosynthesis
MNACDVLLFTSMYEGSPNVIKEALACNLPIVSVDVGDVRERLEGVAGCAVRPDDDLQGLSSALTAVLQQRMRIQGRIVVRELAEELLAERTVGIYELALKKRRATAQSESGGSVEAQL